jgi:hypothetical protein
MDKLKLVLLFALARTVFCGYCAATQSITTDEAFSYNDFISGNWSHIYARYDANNHVLYSILAKASITVFGTSEFTLRLPSVVAGFFLVLGVYAVLAVTIESRMVRWIALLALGLHPLMLDLSVAARGYSLSLTLLAWAIYLFLRQRDLISGLLLGLSISSNLTILYPAVGLVVCPFLLRSGDTEKRIQGGLTLMFAALGVFGAICYESLSKATPANFYAGRANPASALMTLVDSSIRGSERAGLFGTYTGAMWIEYLILPLLLVFIVSVSIRTFGRTPEQRPYLAPAAILISALMGLVAAHYLAGLPYPVDRLGVYLVLLFGLAWAIGASEASGPPTAPFGRGSATLKEPRPKGAVPTCNLVLAGLLIVQLLTQFQVRYFRIWSYDLAAKDVALRLREETIGKPPYAVKISATWFQVPALEFYRRVYRITPLQPIQRYDQTPLEGFDYYVLNRKDDESIRGKSLERLHPILSEPISSVLLAKEP